MKRLIAAVLLAGALPLQAVAQDQQPCLRIGQVYSFEPLAGNSSLIVTDRQRRAYKLSFIGICNDLQFNTTLAFRSHGTGQLSCLARGDQVLSPQAAGPPDRCVIQKIETYTPPKPARPE